ncbi:uncharacterized protein MAM_03326 [Metarhizium album ARSEF 1941]|uniref:Uncharacterized protein n=1 Tax=Metarhizium album (strain ARSEF 1941) TaxID=1081103 RepID=A0A0B2WZ72_METAS|nr:uncharacterized protein MAM_03326 [Metarhizium album ARSEF 1941]KHN98864.1 hypothetical protein MAM_03326 [Metarhizium album ARSEF 1941]
MMLQNRGYSLVLYDADVSAGSKTKDTQDYLSRSVIENKKNFFFVMWDYAEISNGFSCPTDFSKCCLNGQPYDGKGVRFLSVTPYGESFSTKLIQEASRPNGQLPKSVLQGMFLLKPESMAYLRGEFSNLFNTEWKIGPDDATKSTILVVDRDTGCQPEGVYPELDTGNGIFLVRDIVKEMAAKHTGQSTLKVISCGYNDESSVTGIGQYWTKLPPVDLIPNLDKSQPVTKRDVQAYFLYWASQENKTERYFQMVVGLRSGVMDLFTFMGIPTVSIGLRNMVGESRHRRLSGTNFKRVNVQYDGPRHPTTAYIQDRYDSKEVLLNSPFWLGDAPGSPFPERGFLGDDERIQQKVSPLQPFGDFDAFVLKVGVRLACQTYLNWGPTVKTARKYIPQVVTTSDARFCYLAEESGTTVKQRLLRRRSADERAIDSMRAQLSNPKTTLQLSDALFDEFYQAQFIEDWRRIRRYRY